MKKYKCVKCDFEFEIEENDEKKACPKCGALLEIIDEEDEELDLTNLIDSVVSSKEEEQKQKIVNENVLDKKVKISQYNCAITRIPEKCINCGQCKKTCENIVNIRYDLNEIKEPICIGCGQCILNCPTGAMIPKYSYHDVKNVLLSNQKIVVGLISPAVRVSIGEMFNIEPGENVENLIVSGLKKLGFDYVFDTAFGADLTILEEVTELAERLKEGKNLPQFTSCCPAWVKYAEIYHPELIDNISTCKSPIGMQCSIIKSYFCEERKLDSSKIVTVAITPCTAKKVEAREYTPNIDYVLTASELVYYFNEENINLNNLSPMDYDELLGQGSGSGVIFGTSGGVMESAIRTIYKILTKENLTKNQLVFEELRGFDGIKVANIKINKLNLKVAAVQQLENLEKLLINDEYKKYHFIEVMNCKGGCIGGGGQPLCAIPKLDETREKRQKGLYSIDKKRTTRFAYSNKEVKELYKKYLGQPLSDKSLNLLHTSYSDKSNLLNKQKN